MKKLIKIIIAISLILMVLSPLITVAALQPETAQAQDTNKGSKSMYIPKPDTLPGPSEKMQEEAKVTEYATAKVLATITKFLMAFAAISCFIFLVISGIRFMVAYGNSEAVSGAKRQAQWAVIGLLISIFGYAIVSIITSISF